MIKTLKNLCLENLNHSKVEELKIISKFDLCINRLNCLYQHEMEPILRRLSQLGIIAGGSVVYACNDFVPKSSVGDIDVFITRENFLIAIKEIHELFPEAMYQPHEESCRSTSILNIEIFEDEPNIQLIVIKKYHPMEIIQSFDLDYVQCGLHLNKIYQTKACEKSFESRIVQYSMGACKIHRLDKAKNKGFIPIIIPNVGEDNNQHSFDFDPRVKFVHGYSGIYNFQITECDIPNEPKLRKYEYYGLYKSISSRFKDQTKIIPLEFTFYRDVYGYCFTENEMISRYDKVEFEYKMEYPNAVEPTKLLAMTKIVMTNNKIRFVIESIHKCGTTIDFFKNDKFVKDLNRYINTPHSHRYCPLCVVFSTESENF